MSAILKYGELDLNDGVTYKLMREGFKYPLPTEKQTFADSPLAPGQKPSGADKPNNRTLTFSIFVIGTDGATLDTALNALFAAALQAESIVTWCPKGRTETVYFKAYRAPGIDPSSYFRTEYRGTNQCIVTWSCQGYPYGNLDRVTLPLIDFKGLNGSFEKRSGDNFENFTETVSGGIITANTTDYLDGTCSLKMTTTNGAHTCKVDDEDFLIVNELHHENYKMFAYKNSGTLTLDFDLLCYDIDGVPLGTLSLLTAYNPAATTWMDVLKVAGSPVVYPSNSGLSPRFPVGTVKVKREIRHDTTVGVVSIDSLVAADSEYVVGHEVEAAMGIHVPPGDCLGDAPSRAKIYVSSAYCTGPWSPQASGQTVDIYDIHALDATHGYAVGDLGYIFFYNGIMWATQTSGVSVPLNAVSAFNSTHIWAVGNEGTIRFSPDSATWGGQNYPAPTAGVADMVLNEWNTNTDLTYWSETLTSGNIYRYGVGPDFSAQFQPLQPSLWMDVLITSDSGHRAAIDIHDTYAVSVEEYPLNFDYRGTAQLILSVLFYNAGGTYLGSKDVGFDIWPITRTMYVGPADYFPGTTQIALQARGLGQTTGSGINMFALLIDNFAITRVDSPDLYGVHAIAANNIIAVGQYGCIIKSADGTTWTHKTSGTVNRLNAVHASDATHIVAVGDNGTILTSADGTTWTVRVSGVTKHLYGVYVLDATHAWAVGENRTILFSADAGVTWTPQTSGTTKTLKSVYVFDATHVWTVGADGTLLFFNGTVWTAQGSGTLVDLNGVSGLSATSVYAVGDSGAIIHGLSTVGAMPMTNLIIGQRDDYAANWNPVQDAVGTTQTLLYNRHGQYYRSMAAGASNKFRFPVGSHRGRYIISLGISFGASTAYDQVTIDCYLEAADGTRLTATTVSLTPLDMGDPGLARAYTNDPAAGASIALSMNPTSGLVAGDVVIVSSSAGTEVARITTVTTNVSITVDYLTLNHTTTNPLVTLIHFKEVAFATSGTRLADLSLPSHYIPKNADMNNIYQVIEVKASGSLATTEWLDCLTLIPVDKCVELLSLSNNFIILDSEDKTNLVSQDGSLDTATQYDPTKTVDAPRFEACPAGMNLSVVAGNIVTGDERLTPKLDIYLTYLPQVLMIPEP